MAELKETSQPAEMPISAVMAEMATSFRIAKAIHAIAKLGVADQLKDGPKHVDELAKQVNANPDALFRILRFLCSYNIFQRSDEKTFSLTPLAECLRSDAVNSMRNFVLL